MLGLIASRGGVAVGEAMASAAAISLMSEISGERYRARATSVFLRSLEPAPPLSWEVDRSYRGTTDRGLLFGHNRFGCGTRALRRRALQ